MTHSFPTRRSSELGDPACRWRPRRRPLRSGGRRHAGRRPGRRRPAGPQRGRGARRTYSLRPLWRGPLTMTAPRYRLDGNTRLDARKTPGWPTLRPPTLEAPPAGPLTLLPISEGRLSLESTDGTLGSLRLPPWLAVGPRGEARLLPRGPTSALPPPAASAP